MQHTGNTAECNPYIRALEKQTVLFAVWITLQSMYQERVALRCLPFSLFLSADLYFSSFAHFKAEFDCFGFAGRCLLRPGVYLLGWYQTCDNTGLQPRLFSVLLVIFFLRVYGLTACCTVSKEEQGSGLVADWGRQKPPVPFRPEIQKAPGSLPSFQSTSLALGPMRSVAVCTSQHLELPLRSSFSLQNSRQKAN